MKQLFFLFLLFALSPFYSRAQCSIYVSDATGAFGAGYNNDNAPTTIQECRDVAIKACREKGGTNCVVMKESYQSGWWGFANGQKADGRNYFQGIGGASSKSEAEAKVRQAYREGGGAGADKIPVYTWYAYSNPK